MKERLSIDSADIQRWIGRLPEGFRGEAASAIRVMAFAAADFAFELEAEDGGAGLWLLQGQQAGEEMKANHPFVNLANYPGGVAVSFNVFHDASFLHATVELVDQPDIRRWKIYAGEDLSSSIRNERYLALRAAMYELRGSTVLPLGEGRAAMIMQAMIEWLDDAL